MEEVAAVRRAALAGVDDVEPERLRDRITARLDDASLAPGVLTLVAEAAARGIPVADSDADRAAGVQLIYEGLVLTRRLAHDDPWTTGDRDDADLDILIADILVSRGFYLLARTDAAAAAVDVVREFGKDQTELRTTGDDSLDGNLEVDICDLAVVAGVTASGHEPTTELRAVGADLAADGLPDAETVLSGGVAEELASHTGANQGTEAAADH
ncbi:DUF7114 family protein [Haloarcula salinisoli]|uniref:Uncharacterized protein n=1 Tax=Haloarcula salinisoli TaxID=2487746 RepID=A0A8J7YJJ0_9EURY|nr:hypothetical protein [Halomicroarcula salinisoli]MBX0286539.1 hypothetical protein [Halomicroarcula salinisoli]MBX0303889.1 hypothetical protein [Halomicroarcula salinisoli]